jgi:LmbE family N-acetylglucosaminyl deacetylase
MTKTVLIVAPHPDDESIGAGGTLLKHKANNDSLNWLIITHTKDHPDFTKVFSS